MAHQIEYHSKTDFTLNGHYCYIDADGEWNSNPPLDNADVNLMQIYRRGIETCKKL